MHRLDRHRPWQVLRRAQAIRQGQRAQRARASRPLAHVRGAAGHPRLPRALPARGLPASDLHDDRPERRRGGPSRRSGISKDELLPQREVLAAKGSSRTDARRHRRRAQDPHRGLSHAGQRTEPPRPWPNLPRPSIRQRLEETPRWFARRAAERCGNRPPPPRRRLLRHAGAACRRVMRPRLYATPTMCAATASAASPRTGIAGSRRRSWPSRESPRRVSGSVGSPCSPHVASCGRPWRSCEARHRSWRRAA